MRAALACSLLVTLVVPAAAAPGPPKSGVVTGLGRAASLYAANCSRCHGPHGGGLPGQGPSLKDSGALAADFYLRTGYMPLDSPAAQPSRSRVLFSSGEIRAITAYVAALGKGPAVPHPRWRTGSVAVGMKLFRDHCAGCHQIVAKGGYVTGARVPPLDQATVTQIAEAVRVGPYLMPRFSESAISSSQLNDLVAYVQYAKHPDNRGGWAIGDLGPWPEGLVTWLLGTAALVALCTVLGRRLRR
jgi:ubiquinol-cytochrome c reductase cytochrome c subunit